jgi:pimeloyl-ACP methyl ester carboxylesterase
MDAPETHYAKSGAVRIAYQVTGSGPIDLVFVPGFVSNLDLWWEEPIWAQYFGRLAAFSRLILFEKRGTGLSDHTAPIANLEDRMDDVRAVMDASRCQRAALFGISEGGSMSLLFAATYPERVRALILYGCYARHPTLTGDLLKQNIEFIDRAWGTGEFFVKTFLPSKCSDKSVLSVLARRERQSASPSAAITVLQINSEIDARHILPAIRVPTLVLHRIGDSRVTVDAGRYLATQIQGAKYVELPGTDHLPLDITDRIADEIEEFLTGSRPEVEPDRVLATVMFTDIVDSRRAAQLGDRGWRALLDRHDDAVRQQFARFRGREVKALVTAFWRPSTVLPVRWITGDIFCHWPQCTICSTRCPQHERAAAHGADAHHGPIGQSRC